MVRIRNRDGAVVYPVMQFAPGGRQVPGVADVVETLTPVLEPLSIAAWLTAAKRELHGRPIDALRAGNVGRVLVLARQLASTARS
jgi:hypothetical protein